MHLTTFLGAAATIATVAAIDLKGWHNSGGCTTTGPGSSGGYVWTNVEPDQCQKFPKPVRSTGIFAVPKEWTNIEVADYTGEGCTQERRRSLVDHSKSYSNCLAQVYKENFQIIGIKYWFKGSTRRSQETHASQGDLRCRGPDGMFFGDGHTYNITGLDPSMIETLELRSDEERSREFHHLKM